MRLLHSYVCVRRLCPNKTCIGSGVCRENSTQDNTVWISIHGTHRTMQKFECMDISLVSRATLRVQKTLNRVTTKSSPSRAQDISPLSRCYRSSWENTAIISFLIISDRSLVTSIAPISLLTGTVSRLHTCQLQAYVGPWDSLPVTLVARHGWKRG